MSVRPRLVEEGTPIYQQNGRQLTDFTGNAGSSVSSSLLKRATRQGARTVKTRIVIGSNDDDDADSSNKSALLNNTNPIKDRCCLTVQDNHFYPTRREGIRSTRFGTERQSSRNWRRRKKKKGSVVTQIVIGGAETPIIDHRCIVTAPSAPPYLLQAVTTPPATTIMPKHEDRMELDDIIPKVPLLVLDGANIAYAYAYARARGSSSVKAVRLRPVAHGIKVAAHYFLKANCRVQVVLPTSWMMGVTPRPGHTTTDNGMTMTTSQMDTINDLQAYSILCTTPPADDDDAYAITIARREDARAQRRGGEGGGFVVSNDCFRDAIARDENSSSRESGLRQWIEYGHEGGGPGRVSYFFCDLGRRGISGEKELSFVPNPRHLLVKRIGNRHWIEEPSYTFST